MSSHDGPRSLRSQLTIALALAIAATLAIAFFGVHYAVRAQLLEWSKTRLEKRFDALADFATRNPGRESAADSMLDFRSRAHEDYFEVRDAAGRLLARSQSSRGLALPARAAAISEYGPMYSLRLPDGHPGLALSRRVALPAGDPRGHLVIAVASESVRLEVLERRIHRTLIAFAIVTVVATTLVTALVASRALAPLTRLARHAERIDPDGTRTMLVAEGLPRELAALADKLSDLLRRLFDARDRERRLTRSVAHELRTPVAELRMLAEVGALADSLDDARRTLSGVGDVATEMHRTIDALFALARYESGQEPLQVEPLDLGALVRRQLAQLQVAIAAQGVCLQSGIAADRWVLADSALLGRLVANLLGNAISHSPPGTTVVVELDGGELRVENDAPHLATADVERLGERFFRATSDSADTHAGLGLAIAGAIAAVSGLHLRFELRAGGRLSATVSGFRELDGPTAGAASGDAATVADDRTSAAVA